MSVTVTKTKEYTAQSNTDIAVYKKDDTDSLYIRHKDTGGFILVEDNSGGSDPKGLGVNTPGLTEEIAEYVITINSAPSIVEA